MRLRLLLCCGLAGCDPSSKPLLALGGLGDLALLLRDSFIVLRYSPSVICLPSVELLGEVGVRSASLRVARVLSVNAGFELLGGGDESLAALLCVLNSCLQ